jgi:hypothetical protein
MKKALTYLGISMGLSFAYAVTYVVVMTLTLPKADLAHGQTPFQDPLEFPIMSIVAGISGLVAWPLFAALGRYSPPVTVATITGLTTLLFIVVATPIQPSIGLFGAYIVCLSGLIYCSIRHRKTNIQQSA